MHYIDLHLLSESKYMKAKLISPFFWAKKTHYIALQKYEKITQENEKSSFTLTPTKRYFLLILAIKH